jgi:hypothetical protein
MEFYIYMRYVVHNRVNYDLCYVNIKIYFSWFLIITVINVVNIGRSV